mgnify:CR=1 FL=1
MKNLHTYDWMLILIFLLMLLSGTLSIKLLKRNDELSHSRDSTYMQKEAYTETEKFLYKVIDNQFDSIINLKINNDSLNNFKN